MILSEYLDDKRVVLVGPSPSILEENKGNLIESYDVVVRMNKAIPVPTKYRLHIGQRTDLLYNCLEPDVMSGGNINPQLWNDQGVKAIVSPYPILPFTKQNIYSFLEKNTEVNLPFFMTHMDKYKEIEEITKTRPNTGILTICHLLSYNIKELFVIGMTFGLDGWYKEYSDVPLELYKNKFANGKNHKQQPQLEYLREYIHNVDPRFKPNEILTKIIIDKSIEV